MLPNTPCDGYPGEFEDGWCTNGPGCYVISGQGLNVAKNALRLIASGAFLSRDECRAFLSELAMIRGISVSDLRAGLRAMAQRVIDNGWVFDGPASRNSEHDRLDADRFPGAVDPA